jgi:intein/homing endonuclease
MDKDVMEFSTAPWGLGLGCTSEVPPLYPAQRFLIKMYYGMPLDNTPKRDIIIKDRFNERELYRFNEMEYMKYLRSEGRLNREYDGQEVPNMLMVIGRRAGKCITGDSLVLTDQGIYRIENLGEARPEEFSSFGIGIVQEAGRKSKSRYFYNGGKKPVYRIRTGSGYNIAGTDSHRIKVMSCEGRIEWKYLSDVTFNDFVAVNRNTDLWTEKRVDLTLCVRAEDRKALTMPEELDEKLSNLMGYSLIGGLWGSEKSLFISCDDGDMLTYIGETFKDLFGGVKGKSFSDDHSLYVSNEGISKLFPLMGIPLDNDEKYKNIPWSILCSPKSVVCAFLRGLFESKASIDPEKGIINFSTLNERLVHELQVILLNLGIISEASKRWSSERKVHYVELLIKDINSLRKFGHQIGFDSQTKRDLLDRAFEVANNSKETESIPNQKDRILDLLATLERGSEATKPLKTEELLGDYFYQDSEDLSYRILDRLIETAKKDGAGKEETAHFERLRDCDYFYDRVMFLERGEEPVYDLTVPDGESFVANGITNHNTTITAAVIVYEVYKLLNKYCPQEYYHIMPEDPIKVTCISTSKDTASELFQKITGHIERSEFFRKFRSKPTQQYVSLRTQRDLDKYGTKGLASIQIRVAPCSAKGLRGPGNIVVAFDEMAFFFADEKNAGQSTKDRDASVIHRAATPSVAKFKREDGTPDGKIIMISSPGAKSGKFYEEYERSFEDDNEDLLMVQAPTWEIDPDISSQFLRNKFKENSISFKSEFGAQFSDRLFGWIDDPQIVYQNVTKGLKYKPKSMQRVPHFMGVDIGLKNDGTAVTIGHWVEELVKGEKIAKLEVDVNDWRLAVNEKKDYFVPDEMAEWISSYTNKFYIMRGLLDQYYGMTIIPYLKKKGFRQFEYRDFTNQLNSSVYQVLLTNLLSRFLKLPEGSGPPKPGEEISESELVKEVLKLQAEQKSKYIIKVFAPERAGEYDDRSDSLARMVYIAVEYKDKAFVSGRTDPTKISAIRAARMVRRTEMKKFSVNRPSAGFMSKMGAGRMGGGRRGGRGVGLPVAGRHFR